MEEIRPTEKNLDGVLTVDLEDWRSALYPARGSERRHQEEVDSPSVRASTRMLLEELDDTNTKATFFVVGDVARAAPDLLKEISRKGHEIASHSPTHVPPRAVPRNKLISMIKSDLEFFEEALGGKPLGFRAPYFAVTRSDGWLLEALSNLGFKYDSSVVPTWTPLYGIPYAPKSAYFPMRSDIGKRATDGRIVELPITVWPSWRTLPGIPFGGGFFLRMWPIELTRFGLRRNRILNLPLVLYLHPGDVDNSKERIDGMSVLDDTIQHLGSNRGVSNLRILLREFKLSTISEAFSSVLETVRN